MVSMFAVVKNLETDNMTHRPYNMKSREEVRPRLLVSKSQDCHHLLKIRSRCNRHVIQTLTTSPHVLTSPFNFKESQFAYRREESIDKPYVSLSHLARRAARMRRCQSADTSNDKVHCGRVDSVDTGTSSEDATPKGVTYGPRYRSLSKCLLSRFPVAGDAVKNLSKTNGVFYVPIPVVSNTAYNSLSNHALWTSANSKLPKDVELALRYLQEVIRSGKREMFAASSNALFDAALQYLSEMEPKNSNDSNNNRLSRLSSTSAEDGSQASLQLHSALYEFLSWMDDQISWHLSDSLKDQAKCGITNGPVIKNAINKQNAKESLNSTERGLQLLKELEITLRRIPEQKHFTRAARAASHDSAQDEGGDADGQLKFIDTGQFDDDLSTNAPDPIERLLTHIRKSSEPHFVSIAQPEEDTDENTLHEDDSDSEDDSGVHVYEDRDDEQTHPSEPEQNVDQWISGRTRITTDHTRVFIRILKGNISDVIRTTDAPHFLQLNIAPGNSNVSSTVTHSSQQIDNSREFRVIGEKQKKKNVTNPPATEPFSMQESVLQLDNNGEGKENHFKATTLACYLTLNDNLRFYEERQRRRVVFTNSSRRSTSTGGSGCTVNTPDYVNLHQLLQASSDCHGDATILLPTQYVDDTDESDVERTVSKPATIPAATITSRTTRTAPTRGVIKTSFRANGELPRFARANKPEVTKAITDATQTILPKDNILESLDVSPYLVLRAKESFSKPTEVRGGPKLALIVYATQNCSLLFQEAFIVTYRSFVTSAELIQKLISRYLYMNAEKKTAYQKAARQTFSVLVRVVHELCSLELTRELMAPISSFIYRLIQLGNYEFARILRRRLMEIIEEKSLIAQKAPYPSSSMTSEYCRIPSIFEFRSSALAKQITYLDAELLNRIEPAEMLWWAEEQDEKKSPNVVIFTEHFNRVSYWVRTQVIMQQDQRDREKYLLKFIKIMKQLRKLGNYNSYLAILSALDSGPIRRLDWPRNLRDQLSEHAEIMESSHSFKNYRTLLADTVPPCLPYIGLILQDLTFVHVGNPDYLFADKPNADSTDSKTSKLNQKNLLNYGKRWQQFAILDNIRRFKTWPYDIQRDDKILSAFNNFSDFLQEEETWERSFELKPRAQRPRQKIFA